MPANLFDDFAVNKLIIDNNIQIQEPIFRHIVYDIETFEIDAELQCHVPQRTSNSAMIACICFYDTSNETFQIYSIFKETVDRKQLTI